MDHTQGPYTRYTRFLGYKSLIGTVGACNRKIVNGLFGHRSHTYLGRHCYCILLAHQGDLFKLSLLAWNSCMFGKFAECSTSGLQGTVWCVLRGWYHSCSTSTIVTNACLFARVHCLHTVCLSSSHLPHPSLHTRGLMSCSVYLHARHITWGELKVVDLSWRCMWQKSVC